MYIHPKPVFLNQSTLTVIGLFRMRSSCFQDRSGFGSEFFLHKKGFRVKALELVELSRGFRAPGLHSPERLRPEKLHSPFKTASGQLYGVIMLVFEGNFLWVVSPTLCQIIFS